MSASMGPSWTVISNMLPRDVRYALRMMARTPGFTVIAVLSLALGIGANAAIFSLADALLLRPLPVRDPGRVVTVTTDIPGDQFGGTVSYPNYQDLRDKTRSFDGLTASQSSIFSFAKSGSAAPQRRAGMVVSDNIFHVLGVEPTLGRGFLPEENKVAGRDAVVVLGYDFWNDQFNHDKTIIGRSVRINGINFIVVGVAPKAFTGLDYLRPDLYVPAMMLQRISGAPENPVENRGDYSWQLKGRLKPGVSREQARAELATIWTDLQRQFPQTDQNRAAAVLTELQARVRQKPYAMVIVMLMVLVALVLIIACANVANLLLGRAGARSREIAIRSALGVTRGRLLRQLLTESLVLSLMGAVVGLLFAYGGIRFLQAIPVDSDLPSIIPRLDYRVLLFSLVTALISTLIFGSVPAWHSTKVELVSTLKNTVTSMGSRYRKAGRDLLVISQIALSIVLLVATGMLLDGFRKSLLLNPGFRTEHLMMMEFDTSLVRYSPEQNRNFYRTLVDRARALPELRSVTLTQSVPLSDQGTWRVIPEGYSFPKGQDSASLLGTVVDEHYFETMKTEIVRGRAFTADDKDGSRLVVIVNEEFAKQYWPGQDALGKRLRLNDDKGPWLEVVGIAKTGKYLFIAEPPSPYMYLPFAQNESPSMFLVAESYGNPAALATPLTDIVRAVDVNQPVYNVRTYSNFYQKFAISIPLMIMEMVGAMGLLGLVLALIGIYGLVSYSVARRTKEIGVRMAIGANQSDVLKMVLRESLVLSTLGLFFGGLISVAVGRLLAAGLAGLGTPNAATFVIVPITVFMVTMAACYVPARRASAVNPTLALRYE